MCLVSVFLLVVFINLPLYLFPIRPLKMRHYQQMRRAALTGCVLPVPPAEDALLTNTCEMLLSPGLFRPLRMRSSSVRCTRSRVCWCVSTRSAPSVCGCAWWTAASPVLSAGERGRWATLHWGYRCCCCLSIRCAHMWTRTDTDPHHRRQHSGVAATSRSVLQE